MTLSSTEKHNSDLDCFVTVFNISGTVMSSIRISEKNSIINHKHDPFIFW